MDPAKLRDMNFDDMQADLSDACLRVYYALRAYGPITTASLAERIGASILATRPRVTELCKLYGLAECVDHVTRNRRRHGIYRAIPIDEALLRWQRAQQARQGQMLLNV